MKISVVIPTFNRPNYLYKLLTQFDNENYLPDEILVINNCSDLNYEEKSYINIKPKMIVNKINIGGAGNIIRCFEEAESQWLWIIGDDDEIKPNAIDIIRNDIKNNQDAATIFYSNYMGPISENFHTKNTDEFSKSLNEINFGGRLWLSGSLYNRKYLKNTIAYMYEYPGSSPQMTWQLINADKLCYFSTNEISKHHIPDENELWNVLRIQNQMTQLLMIPEISGKLREALSVAVSNWYTGHDETLIRACQEYIKNENHPNKSSILFAYLCRYVVAYLAMNNSEASKEVISLYDQLKLNPNTVHEFMRNYDDSKIKTHSKTSFFGDK